MTDNCQPVTNITSNTTYVRCESGSAEEEVESNNKEKATCNKNYLPKDKDNGDDGMEIKGILIIP